MAEAPRPTDRPRTEAAITGEPAGGVTLAMAHRAVQKALLIPVHWTGTVQWEPFGGCGHQSGQGDRFPPFTVRGDGPLLPGNYKWIAADGRDLVRLNRMTRSTTRCGSASSVGRDRLPRGRMDARSGGTGKVNDHRGPGRPFPAAEPEGHDVIGEGSFFLFFYSSECSTPGTMREQERKGKGGTGG